MGGCAGKQGDKLITSNKIKYADKDSPETPRSQVPLAFEARLEFLSSQKLSKQLRTQTKSTPEKYLEHMISACEVNSSSQQLEEGITFMRNRISSMRDRILQDIDKRSRHALEVFDFYTTRLKMFSYRVLLQLFVSHSSSPHPHTNTLVSAAGITITNANSSNQQLQSQHNVANTSQQAHDNHHHNNHVNKSSDNRKEIDADLAKLFMKIFSVSVKAIQAAIAMLYPSEFTKVSGFLVKDNLFKEISEIAEQIDVANTKRAEEISLHVSRPNPKSSTQMLEDVANVYLAKLYEEVTTKQVTMQSVVGNYLQSTYTAALDKLEKESEEKQKLIRIQEALSKEAVAKYLPMLYKKTLDHMDFSVVEAEIVEQTERPHIANHCTQYSFQPILRFKANNQTAKG